MSHPRQQRVVDSVLKNAGANAADANVDAVYAPFDGFISNVYKDQVSGPAGSAEIIDIHKNGTTIFATATKITTADGGVVRTYSALTSNQVAKGDRITMDIDQAGSGTPGENASVHIRFSAFRVENDAVTNVAPSALK